MSMDNLTGSIVALVTPFNEDKSIDFEGLERLVDFHLENGTDGILVLGTTGETSPMTDAEDFAVAEAVVKQVAGRIPVIGGAGSNCTEESLNKALGLQQRGIDGLLLITPYYNKSNEEGIYQHFVQVMDKVDVPCIFYNIPGRTGCSISERNVARLREHPNAWGIKEASGNISYATTVAQYLSDDFRMFSGNDDMVVPILSLGGAGVISVLSNVAPKETHDMVQLCLDGKYPEAAALQIRSLELCRQLFCEVNPIPVKAALNMQGWNVGIPRLPLTELEEEHKISLKAAMQAFGVL